MLNHPLEQFVHTVAAAASENVPAQQARHADRFESAANVPGWHESQTDAPHDDENEPAAHTAHDDAPLVTFENDPGAHASQLDAPAALTAPTPQSLHCVEFHCALNVPSEHALHCQLPLTDEYQPGLHGEHTHRPGPLHGFEKKPAEQFVHTVEPLLLNWPHWHPVHTLDPLTFVNWPPGHGEQAVAFHCDE